MSKTNNEHKKCTHYWIVEPPTKGNSIGKCKFCGARKEFVNDWLIALNMTNHSRKHSRKALNVRHDS